MKSYYLYRIKFLIVTLSFVLICSSINAQDYYFILLDPGHGGSDGGAPGACGISEKFYNLDFALNAYDKIDNELTHNWLAYSTRDDDDDFPSPQQRYQMANNLFNDQEDAFGYKIPKRGVDFFLSVHCNSGGSTAHGTEVLYKDSSETGLRIKRSKICATVLLQSHIEETRKVLWSASSRWLKSVGSEVAVTYSTRMPAILLETEFISNPNICSWMDTPQYIDAVGDGINFLMKCISLSNELWVARAFDNDITSYEGWGSGCLLFRNTNNGATQYRYVNNAALDIYSWNPLYQTKVIVDDNVHVATINGGIINVSPMAIYIMGQGGSFEGSPTGIEDGIAINLTQTLYNVNQTYWG